MYLLGGASGTEYLVAARGLEQPRAGKGVVRPGVERLYGTNTSQTIRWLTLGVSGSLFLKILSATGEKPIYRTTFGVKGTPFSFILSSQRCGPLGVGPARRVTQ